MILFIDDEEKRVETYLQELTLARKEVSFQYNVDKALAFFKKNAANIDLVILDIMMPFGDAFTPEETKQGLRTGLSVYQRIRERSSDLPMLILTNVSDEQIAEQFQKEKNCRFVRKQDCLPRELTTYVENIIKNKLKRK